MNIRTTTDPITLRDVSDPQNRPCLYDGDGDNGIEIYFESDQNRSDYLSIQPHDPKVIKGNDSEDYVAEG
ncbi:MAG: hypothetical protein AMJ53_16480 [Gammaproteobacteria bacterium SG8_11]|nr:MAG: hypothetical protein AMJ53_16480 [Gammaproteobacteria bacterium SG8_11]